MKKINIIFCGTPELSIPTLETLLMHENVTLQAVVTALDKPTGRGQKITSPPIARFAKEKNLHLIQTSNINKSKELNELLENHSLDAFIVLAFSQFLGEKMLEAPSLGAFNIHPSLLPSYRGAAPIQHAIWNGETKTGVSIQKMVKKMDAGDVVYTHEFPISPFDTSGDLSKKMQEECAMSVKRFIPELVQNRVVSSPQRESLATFAPRLKKSDGRLCFTKNSDSDIIDHVRAFDPWPGTFTYLNGKKLKVLEVRLDPIVLKPGELCTKYNSLLVGTKTGSIRLVQVQLEGKKKCSDKDLLNGLKNKIKKFKLTEQGEDLTKTKTVTVSPSLLSCNFLNIEKEVMAFEGLDDIWLHLDVMDGHFVPNLTFGHPIIKKITSVTQIPTDVHLMVSNPDFYIETLKDMGIHNLTFHVEAVKQNECAVLVKKAKKYYKNVGLSIKPKTEVDRLDDTLLSLIDLVLVMSVEPGFGGQSFIEQSYAKIAALNEKKKAFNFKIQVDGGVSAQNASKLITAGADNLVAGSYIFKAKTRSYHDKVQSLRKQ